MMWQMQTEELLEHSPIYLLGPQLTLALQEHYTFLGILSWSVYLSIYHLFPYHLSHGQGVQE